MEIEFNPGRLSESGTNNPVTRRVSTSASDAAALPYERTQALEQSLRDAPQVRPEVVERAKSLVNDVKYPPAEVLDRIATLLAIHVNQ